MSRPNRPLNLLSLLMQALAMVALWTLPCGPAQAQAQAPGRDAAQAARDAGSRWVLGAIAGPAVS